MVELESRKPRVSPHKASPSLSMGSRTTSGNPEFHRRLPVWKEWGGSRGEVGSSEEKLEVWEHLPAWGMGEGLLHNQQDNDLMS